MDDVLKLISVTVAKDAYGVERHSFSEREVYCKVGDITRAEFFGGGRNGLNPSMRFDVFFADYHGEDLVEYRGKRYAIYRTFHAEGDYIELYAERQGGANVNN